MKSIATALSDNATVQVIEDILKHGDTVELKRERDNLVIVEIRRRAKIKTPVT